jgi:hypothetical protein
MPLNLGRISDRLVHLLKPKGSKRPDTNPGKQ